MQLKSLEIFMAVVEHKSFSIAAEKQHTVQSNITSHIKKLEQELGCELLSRQTPIRVTNAGHQLLNYATKMLQLHRDAKSHFLSDRLSFDEPLKIGSMESTAAFRLPYELHAVLNQFPQLKFNIFTQPSRQLIDAVMQHEFDCAFIGNTVEVPHLYNLPVWQEKLVLVAAKHLDVQLTADSLIQYRFISFRQGCFYRRRIETFLQSFALPASLILEMGSLDGIVGCVSLGMGLAILPERYLHQTRFSEHLQHIEIDEKIAQSTTYLIAQQPETWGSNLKLFMQYFAHNQQQFSDVDQGLEEIPLPILESV